MDDQVVVSGSYLPNPLVVAGSGIIYYDFPPYDFTNPPKVFIIREGRDANCYLYHTYGPQYEGELTISQVMAIAVLRGDLPAAEEAARMLADRIQEVGLG